MAKILVIDDEEYIRSLLHSLLSTDHTLIEASNGPDGLILLDHYQPDLIITDLIMPHMSGCELVRNLRASSSRTKIIVISAFLYGPEECELLLKAGADLFLAKPFNISALEQAIADLLA